MIRNRLAIALSVALFVVLAGTGVGNAFWSTQASTSGSVAAGKIGVGQSGFAALAVSYTANTRTTTKPVTVTNSGTIAAPHTITLGAQSANNLARAAAVSIWTVARATDCTSTTVTPATSVTTGTWASSPSISVTTQTPIARSAAVVYCVRSAISEADRINLAGGSPAIATLVVSSGVGAWASTTTASATQSVLDSVAPTTPGTPVASGTTNSATTITWPASSDTGGVTSYQVYRNGALIATVPNASYTNTGLAVSTSYTYTITARDAANNTSATSAPAIVTTLGVDYSGWYRIVNPNSGMCVDGFGASQANGTKLIIYGCHGGTNQVWQFVATTDGFYKVIAQNAPALAWDIDSTNQMAMSDGAPAQLWTYGGGTNQQWRIDTQNDGTFHFVNRGSSKCLDVTGVSTVQGTQLQQWACGYGNLAQAFTLTKVG